MRLYEFAAPNPLIPKLVAVSDQLTTELSDEEIQSGMSIDDFLSYLQKFDIVLDQTDLYDMIKLPPLINIISNIQGDNVIFKGAEDQEVPDEEDNSADVVAGMASRAAGSPQRDG